MKYLLLLFCLGLFCSCASLDSRPKLPKKPKNSEILAKGYVLRDEYYRSGYPERVSYIFDNQNRTFKKIFGDYLEVEFSEESEILLMVIFYADKYSNKNYLEATIRTKNGKPLNQEKIRVYSKKLGELELATTTSRKGIPPGSQFRYKKELELKHRYDGVTQLRNDLVVITLGSRNYRFIHPESDILYQ